MVKVVFDTSVIVKWFLPEEDSTKAEPYLADLLRGSLEAVVPASALLELSNTLWVQRRNGLDASAAQAVLRQCRELPLEVAELGSLLPAALDLAFRLEIATYDAIFVALARDLECDLITADQPLWEKVHRECPWVKRL